MIDFKDALKLISKETIDLKIISKPLEKSLNYYLAEVVVADRDYPPFNRAAMDGFAVNSEWFNALDKKAMVSQGKCFAGEAFSKIIDTSKALKIMTGSSVPPGLDSIIKTEDCDASCDLITFKTDNTQQGLNIAKKGEDIAKNEVILKKGTLLNAANIQALATIGKSEVNVFSKPKIALITTGNEVRNLKESVTNFQIRNSNKWSITSSLEELSYDLTFFQHVADDKETTANALNNALNSCDIVLFTGGVSMGDADFIPDTLAKNGVSNIFHKVAIKPGKPIWFGKNSKKVVFGLPGNPLSAFQDFHLFVKPFLSQIQGHKNSYIRKGILNTDILAGKIDRFLPFVWESGELTPKKFNGSGDITSIIGTSGMIHIPKGNTYTKGDVVEYFEY